MKYFKVVGSELDKFTFYYAKWLGLFFPPIIVAFIFLDNSILFTLGILYIVPFDSLLCLYFLIKLITHLQNKHWLQVSSIIISPLIIGALLSILYISNFSYLPQWISFYLNKSDYLEQISHIPRKEGEFKTKTFHVGDYGGFGNAGGSEDIVYDESDKIAISSRSNNCTKVIKIEGHFYFTNTAFDCDPQK